MSEHEDHGLNNCCAKTRDAMNESPPISERTPPRGPDVLICSVCLEEVKLKGVSYASVAPGCCGQLFHMKCMNVLIKSGHAKCPNCREPLPVSLSEPAPQYYYAHPPPPNLGSSAQILQEAARAVTAAVSAADAAATVAAGAGAPSQQMVPGSLVGGYGSEGAAEQAQLWAGPNVHMHPVPQGEAARQYQNYLLSLSANSAPPQPGFYPNQAHGPHYGRYYQPQSSHPHYGAAYLGHQHGHGHVGGRRCPYANRGSHPAMYMPGDSADAMQAPSYWGELGMDPVDARHVPAEPSYSPVQGQMAEETQHAGGWAMGEATMQGENPPDSPVLRDQPEADNSPAWGGTGATTYLI
jgi:hypothetical protein